MFDNDRSIKRTQRQQRVRKRVRGTNERPRLCVFRSARHIYVQVISDENGKTLLSASTLSKDIRESTPNAGNVAAAKQVGALVARRCLESSIQEVVFDRNGFLFHGRVKALADAAREAGLKF
ncbi:MAG: 50S ribosomal protein L18 [Candidatus Binatia bacterium]